MDCKDVDREDSVLYILRLSLNKHFYHFPAPRYTSYYLLFSQSILLLHHPNILRIHLGLKCPISAGRLLACLRPVFSSQQFSVTSRPLSILQSEIFLLEFSVPRGYGRMNKQQKLYRKTAHILLRDHNDTASISNYYC